MKDLELLVETVTFEPEYLAESAWSGHLPYAHFAIRKLKPKLMVELGTHRGTSYFTMCQTISQYSKSTKAFAVDTWQGEAHAGFYDESVYKAVASENQKYKSFSTLLRCTFDEALSKFENGSVDLLHIDGYHTYEAVKHDFESWLPKLAPGATVLFHDTSETRDDFGVHIFWAELMKQYAGFEIKHSHGLGVLQLPGAKVNLIPEAHDLASHVNFFAQLGLVSEAKVILHNSSVANLRSLGRQLHRLTRRVEQFETSTSWKITAPIRAIGNLKKKR